jgi:hypothetical protein
MNRYNLKHASLQKRREPIKLEPKQWSKVYKKVYKIIGKKTPLYGDCGLLCQKACCQGDSKDGMLLFPGEEVIFMKGRAPKIDIREWAPDHERAGKGITLNEEEWENLKKIMTEE